MSDTPPPEPRTPSEAMAQGLCAYCLGNGFLYSIIEQVEVTCRVCKGSGEFTFPEDEGEAWP